jgi:UDP-GlcNAc:undecaprenyl-phosphate GlcNAc-1-phosphate transferase
MGRRALRGRPMFQADKEHIHHRLLALGLSHRQAVLVLYGFCVLLGAVALVLTYTNSLQSAVLLLALGVIAFAGLRGLGYMRLDRMSHSASERKKNKALRAAARPLGRRLQKVRTLDEVWVIVIESLTVFGAVSVRVGPSPEFSHGFQGADNSGLDLFQIRFGLAGSESLLELGWADGRREIDRDTEIAVEIFCEHLADAFALLKVGSPAPRPPARQEPTA